MEVCVAKLRLGQYNVNMNQDWERELFTPLGQKQYFRDLMAFLDFQYQQETVYPPRELLFHAFDYFPPAALKIVIIGQDPYHEPDQATGLAFSVPSTTPLPPSLKNIYREIEFEYGVAMAPNGDLSFWAQQGVLLLNSILSVKKGIPLSHKSKEYHQLLLDTLSFINKLPQPIVFLLWGRNAKDLAQYLDNPGHLVLKANHPSPLSANRGGWFHHNHFKLANEFLTRHQAAPIKWLNRV